MTLVALAGGVCSSPAFSRSGEEDGSGEEKEGREKWKKRKRK